MSKSVRNRIIRRSGNPAANSASSHLIRVDYTAEGRRRPLGYRDPSGDPHLFAVPHSAGMTLLESTTAAEILIPIREAAKLAAVYNAGTGTPLPIEALRHALASLRVGDATRVRLYDANGRLTFDIQEGNIDSSDVVSGMAASMFFRCFQATADAPAVSARLQSAESAITAA